eukprot:SAG22_NODE_3990_length_1434_cov_2.810487_2_plen_85_part_00
MSTSKPAIADNDTFIDVLARLPIDKREHMLYYQWILDNFGIGHTHKKTENVGGTGKQNYWMRRLGRTGQCLVAKGRYQAIQEMI